MQKFLSFECSAIENPAIAAFSGVFQEISVNRSFGFLEKRQPLFPSTARTAGGSDRPGAAKAPGLSPAFPSSPVFFGRCWGMISGPMSAHPATNGPQRRFRLWRCWELFSVAGGPQTGSQGLTRRIALLSEIWRGSAPSCGAAVGDIILRLPGWAGSYSGGFHCAFDRIL